MQFEHWWFKGKREIAKTFFSSTSKRLEILDIGSGYGALLPVLKQWGNVDAIEPYVAAHPSLFELGVRKIYENVDFPTTYPAKKYHIVSLFDALEHIKYDQKALEVIIEKLLKMDGICIITVPAYMWLWTKRDEVHRHYRRYTKLKLKKLLVKVGFKNIQISYYMTLLFPVALMQRLFRKIELHNSDRLWTPGRLINMLLWRIFSFESSLLRFTNLPFGLSLIAKAEK